jgi:ABC-2 type transport system ATP-binding protein
MNFEQGQMHGIIGPEGAGKTTFIRILLGLLKSAGGQVNYLYNGKVQQYADIRSDIAYMPQSQSLYADLSIGEHLDFFKEMYGISEEDFEVKKTELLQITRLKDFIDRPAGKLSGGMYKKLGLICALLRSPKIIFLDEPTNGVDPISRREFWELLYRLADQNILIILTTAYMDEAERCAVVHLISNGKVVDEGEPKQLLAANGVNSFDELFLKRGHRE